MTADKAKITRLLKTARGQIDGILKMIEENRYCIDVSNQIMASQAILAKVNKEVLHAHLSNCVLASCGEGSKEKVEEIKQILDKLL
ncbi:MAG: metal-sensing transcriptional repressor [Corallococcus sp.]|nr:metal-sensing transcriptional repressor [Bacillota bacterium]MCM1533897.1 metal-sensing transcriptional repressor [Corallococcus sp.]